MVINPLLTGIFQVYKYVPCREYFSYIYHMFNPFMSVDILYMEHLGIFFF